MDSKVMSQVEESYRNNGSYIEFLSTKKKKWKCTLRKTGKEHEYLLVLFCTSKFWKTLKLKLF